MDNPNAPLMGTRFRGFFPVVIDVETGGFNPDTDALLEIAAVTLSLNEQGLLQPKCTYAHHIEPFEGAKLDPEALKFTGIDPYHPFRFAVSERHALEEIFKIIRAEMKQNHCTRAILVGHNAAFDLSFLQAAVERAQLKRNPFHPFSTLDTVALSAIALGQTVLAKAVRAARLPFDHAQAHSAIYDAERTADLFCFIANQWQQLGGWNTQTNKPNISGF